MMYRMRECVRDAGMEDGYSERVSERVSERGRMDGDRELGTNGRCIE